MGDYWTNAVRHPEDVGVGHIRRTVTLGQNGFGAGIPIGTLEAGAVPLRATVIINTAFNAGTTNVLSLGSTADDDGLITSTNAGAGSTGIKAGTGALLGVPLASDTTYYAKFSETGTAATTGKATMIVEFVNKREVEGIAFPNN